MTYFDCLYFTPLCLDSRVSERVITHSNASGKIVDLAHTNPLTPAKNYLYVPYSNLFCGVFCDIWLCENQLLSACVSSMH